MDLTREYKILSLSFKSIRNRVRKLTEKEVVGNFNTAVTSVS